MKRASIILALVVAGLIGYRAGLDNQCTVINLNNDYSFTCDGHKVQGPTYPKEYVTHSWEFHSSVK